MTAIERKVSRWPDRWREAWYERSGILLDSGVRPDLADQRAYLETAKRTREVPGE